MDTAPAEVKAPNAVERLWWLAVLTAPWSVELALGTEARLSVPQEPLLLLIILLAAVTARRSLTSLRSMIVHPILVAVAGSLMWTAVTAIFSTSPVVSFKVLLIRCLQAAVYFGGGLIFLTSAAAVRRLAVVGALGLAPIAVWAIVRAQLLDGWQAVHASAMPFFPNRLELTVVAAFWLLTLLSSRLRDKRLWFVATPLLAAVAVLHGRAALVAIVVGLGCWWLLRRRPQPAHLAAALLLAVACSGAVALDLMLWRESGRQIFRPTTVLEPVWRVVTASEVAVDESLLERLNRWRCALMMAADHPMVGFGPGTFEAEYGVYQRPGDRTRWSTDAGNLGDAHSEPLGRLAEEGVTGLMLQLLLLTAVVASGLRVVRASDDPVIRAEAAAWTGAVLGLAAASVFVGVSDLSGTGLVLWLAPAVMLRLARPSHQSSSRGPRDVVHSWVFLVLTAAGILPVC